MHAGCCCWEAGCVCPLGRGLSVCQSLGPGPDWALSVEWARGRPQQPLSTGVRVPAPRGSYWLLSSLGPLRGCSGGRRV